MRNFRGVLVTSAVTLLAVVGSQQAKAQAGTVGRAPATTQVKHSVACPACKVVFTKVATIGRSGEPVEIGGRAGLERDSKGRYFAISLDHFQIVVFDSSGRYLSVIGRKGDGPGEFGMSSGISFVRIGVGDTLYVIHSGNKLEVFSPTLARVRSVALPATPRPYPSVLPDGNLLITANISRPAQAGMSFHVVDKTGAVKRSYGDGAVMITPSQPAPELPEAVLAQDARSFWTVSDTSYALRQWNLDGRAGQSFTVTDVPWFKKNVDVDTVMRGRRRQFTGVFTQVVFSGVDRSGRIWLTGLTRSAVMQPYTTKYHLEIFDPRLGRVLTMQPLVGNPIRLIQGSDNLVYSADMDASGLISYAVWRVQLTGI